MVKYSLNVTNKENYMIEKEKEFDLRFHLESAYKKLKSYSYYDNKNIFLKNRIVDFENNQKMIQNHILNLLKINLKV